MFGLSFRFPAGRYHATPWGRNVNEADVAWPPEPWRILRALVATYWRKGDRGRWDRDDLAHLVETLAADLPTFRLPEGAVHAHTRHYMPTRKDKKTGDDRKTLVFDGFLHLPQEAELVAMWPGVSLDGDLMALARDLAAGIGYLGRAESWTECRVVSEPPGEPNCVPAESGASGDLVRVLVPRSAAAYGTERRRLLQLEERKIRDGSAKALTERQLRPKVNEAFRVRGKGGADTLPEQLLDALSLDTADLQKRGWSQPPAAYEVVYARASGAAPGVLPRARTRTTRRPTMPNRPTIARYLLAGRPRPRIEDAVKIGEVMRAAAMSKFGWRTDEATGKRLPLAPWQVSGRDEGNRPIRDPTHPHAFWLPEDADDDGWIDHFNGVHRRWNRPEHSFATRPDYADLANAESARRHRGQPKDRRVATRVGGIRTPGGLRGGLPVAGNFEAVAECHSVSGFGPFEKGRLSGRGGEIAQAARNCH